MVKLHEKIKKILVSYSYAWQNVKINSRGIVTGYAVAIAITLLMVFGIAYLHGFKNNL